MLYSNEKHFPMTELQAALCTQFEAMPRKQQIDLLQKDGVYIGKQKTNGHCLLYHYQTIYVEVMYAVHRSEIIELRCLTDMAILDVYFSEEESA